MTLTWRRSGAMSILTHLGERADRLGETAPDRQHAGDQSGADRAEPYEQHAERAGGGRDGRDGVSHQELQSPAVGASNACSSDVREQVLKDDSRGSGSHR